MKHVQLFEQFINEKAYQMTGSFGAKGIPGKVLFGFKKQVESVTYNGDAETTLAEINAIWSEWADKEGAKIIEDLVMKQVKDKDALVYIIATLGKEIWEADTVNRINRPDSAELYISIPNDFVINVGFADDVDAGKFSKKLGGMQNSAAASKFTTVFGEYDSEIGSNNLEIRSGLFMSIDAK